MSNYAVKYTRPLGASRHAGGGAFLNAGVGVLEGETEMVTVFDDFNGVVATDAFGDATNWETLGWVLSDVGVPVGDEVGMNDTADTDQWYPSQIRIFTGTDDDAGGNMQLDRVNASLPASSGGGDFPHLWIPETAAGVTILDSTVWFFSCRIGLRADLTTTGSGDWNSKCFIGWAEAGDVNVMAAATGVITINSTGPLVGFHIPEDGSIDAISHRTVSTAMAEGTNFTELAAAGTVDGTVANGADVAGDTMWFDLALRMHITDMSDDAANGSTQFFWRQVPKLTGVPGVVERAIGGEGLDRYKVHGTTLTNQTPNNDVALVPTIEVINGPTAGRDGVVFIDNWAFGVSRMSRT